MSHRIRHRWHPPGKGWIVTADIGRLAVWMRPEPEGGVSIALYAAEYFYDNDDAEVWIVRVPRGSWLPGEVMDKPHRIRWALSKDDPDWAGDVQLRVCLPRSDRGHRRGRRHREFWHWPLPRKIRTALQPPARFIHRPAEWDGDP